MQGINYGHAYHQTFKKGLIQTRFFQTFSKSLTNKLLRKVQSKMLRQLRGKESFTKKTIINLIQNGLERTH